MFFRVLAEGHTLVYEPSAVIRHRHRRSYTELRRQIASNGYGFCSYLVANALEYSHERMRFVYLAAWWVWRWQMKRLVAAAVRPTRLPRQLVSLEFWAGLTGLFRYAKARKTAREIVAEQGPQEIAGKRIRQPWIRRRKGHAWVGPTGVRTIDVEQGIGEMTGVEDYELVRVFVTWGERLVGSVTVANQHRNISARRLREAIADGLAMQFLEYTKEGALGSAWNSAEATILDWYGASEPPVLQEHLRDSIPVSIVIATLDRPEGLRECLRSISAQRTARRLEVIVVDNNESSGKTRPVVAAFPGVRLIAEKRRGLSYARNAGILAATGQIVIATDDDVVIPPYWLERLVAPFVRPDVMVVTGNVLPISLETDAQLHFETYGGLGRGFRRFEVDGDWFESFHLNAAPTWELGATANAAFRSSLFTEPGVGLMDEALGAGMPTGCSEDSYAMYRALKAHHTLVYEPSAYLWHQHRSSMQSLRRQIYSYSKGHVAYHLTTLIRDHDLRAIKRLVVDLPTWRVKQLWARARHRTTYPTSLVAIEILGNLIGPFALLASSIQVAFRGRTAAQTARPEVVALDDQPSVSLADKEQRAAVL
jgi:GT2 family glycosyltransferase